MYAEILKTFFKHRQRHLFKVCAQTNIAIAKCFYKKCTSSRSTQKNVLVTTCGLRLRRMYLCVYFML